jgi:hypothetical protein
LWQLVWLTGPILLETGRILVSFRAPFGRIGHDMAEPCDRNHVVHSGAALWLEALAFTT